ncbi:VIT1/CCC1 transporter family protein [Corynebacterium cystitidis]|uniref:Predicted Fe2+/Mn2+ transporter, VIT1/CCC1 family n=1 Tax=Corynebacterium cystitidis DSM 20524 TaxID=1121357 RepID=A0A1H9QTT1_9CORY|nr:VIT family protein [Corynebacterium cystitidis]WJY81665.1 VIT family protein [Corynebacterium cystitidis DSM 20524]SER63876.1 Predicted Fe2+/Mn2+ transporter, VIT1/CCC1 family [Corynebacterium cystitidis DSM 20524]SNV85158.1 iron and manganese transporter [Corynebacterium cystitidis]
MTETTIPSQSNTGLNEKLNKLRAGVMGANDGIVSTAAVVVGVAGATSDVRAIATAGIAAVIGGAVSMALGEYVSVSSQRDTEEAIIVQEQQLHHEDPKGEFEVLVQEYVAKGISEDTARQVATEVTAHDALEAHLDIHYGIDTSDIVSPWSAAIASFVAFFLGALLPLAAILFPPENWRVPVAFVVTLLALATTGVISAKLGGARPGRAALRLVIGGALALGFTFLVGLLFGETVV